MQIESNTFEIQTIDANRRIKHDSTRKLLLKGHRMPLFSIPARAAVPIRTAHAQSSVRPCKVRPCKQSGRAVRNLLRHSLVGPPGPKISALRKFFKESKALTCWVSRLAVKPLRNVLQFSTPLGCARLVTRNQRHICVNSN